MLIHKFEFLTPLAAIGLILTMIGASLVHLKRKEHKDIIKNIVIMIILVVVFIGRKDLLF